VPTMKHKYGQSVLDAFSNRQPVKFLKQWRHVVVLASSVRQMRRDAATALGRVPLHKLSITCFAY